MRRLWPVVLLLVTIAAGLGGRASSTETSPQPGEAFLPDLRTLVPSDFIVGQAPETGEKILQLSNTVWNAGNGPLELRPENDTSVDPPVTHAFQLLYTEDEEGDLVTLDHEHSAGSFAFHPQHNHWHFQGLAHYSLVEMNSDGGEGATVAESQKISYCMFDQRQIDGSLTNASPFPFYSGGSCDANSNVGYSVGWGDEYGFNFFDQWIPIPDVPPGKYYVVSEADPDGLLRETNNKNNVARAAIVLTDDGVQAITETTGSICKPCGRTNLSGGARLHFRGKTDPAPEQTSPFPDLDIDLSYKRVGDQTWRPFGSGNTSRAFALLDDSDRRVAADGSWDRDFVAYKVGTWVLRAKIAENEYFTSSSVKVNVNVH